MNVHGQKNKEKKLYTLLICFVNKCGYLSVQGRCFVSVSDLKEAHEVWFRHASKALAIYFVFFHQTDINFREEEEERSMVSHKPWHSDRGL